MWYTNFYEYRDIKEENQADINYLLDFSWERKTGLKPATLSLEG